ncbi:MAG: type 1 glutamine amidotransferase [Desulfuromonadaceae bacterium]|nr:type 1 glutamine amidotransferase [Desulfuromonadaceae bacterium]
MLYIIQNDPEVPPGNIIEHLTVPHVVCHPYQSGHLPQLADISALIVLGGAMGANDEQSHPFLAELKKLIRRVVETGVPYLGICLGGQLLAAALGAVVVSRRWEEVGTLDVLLTAEGNRDPLFSGIRQEFRTFQWHHDSFDIPDRGILLASSAACPNQAFRVGTSAWGLQFHPEVTEVIIRGWCAWEHSTAVATEAIVAAFSREADAYRATARHLVQNFLAAAHSSN